MSRDAVICLALASLTLLLYAPVRNHEFVDYDDPGYVQQERVRQGLTLENVHWAFTTFTFSNYHPLTWLSHMLDVSLFGHDAGGHHLVSAALHALNTVVLYLLLAGVTGRAWESLAVTALWSAHPLRVESVAWVAERKDLLCALFFFLSIWCYAGYAKRAGRPRGGAYAASLVCFALALLSKSMAVTLPCVLLLLDFWPLRRQQRWKPLLLEKVPFFLLTTVFSIVTVIAQRQGGAMAQVEHFPMAVRVANAFASLAAYVQTSLWPTGLAVFYPYHGVLDGTRLPMGLVFIGVVLLVAALAAGAALWRRERAVMIGWLWFLGTLVPVIGFVQVGWAARADRYTYIPQVGLLAAIVWGAAALLRPLGPAVLRAAAAVVIVAAGALSLRTLDQLRHWKDTRTLFEHALRVTDHNPVAHGMLGSYYRDRGETDRALGHFQAAMEIVPRQSGPFYHAAGICAARGQHDEAVRLWREAIEREPDSFVAHYDLAVDLAEHGKVEEALPHFARAIQILPESPEAHYAYTLALRQSGRIEEATSAYKRYQELARRRHLQPLPMPTTNPDNRRGSDGARPTSADAGRGPS